MNLAEDSVRGHLDRVQILACIADATAVKRAAPMVRPRTPSGAPMRVKVSAAGDVGWVGDGTYRYSRRQRDGRPWPAIPSSWTWIANNIMGETYDWDCAILNWYEEGAALGWHQDLAERDHSFPIVTISLGDSASWAMRLGEGEPVHRCTVSNGDVTVLDGPTRLALHSIERIKPEPLLSPFGATRGRLSITMRVAT